MNNSDFAHLHVHTEYSTLDGFGKPEDYVKKAKKMGFKYLACTDHGNIDGLIKFQQACDKHGIDPVLGCEAYIVPDLEKTKQRGHVLLLIKNRTGFKNICTLLSFANTEGFYYKPRITYEMLLQYCKGLIVSTACIQSFINQEGGIALAAALKDTIQDDLYFEIMPHKGRQFRKFNSNVIFTARNAGSKIILTNDCHYINSSDWKAQEVLLAIQRKAKWDDEDRFKFKIKGLHLKSANMMKLALRKSGLKDISDRYLLNTIEVAEKCSKFRIKKKLIHLPKVPGIDPNDEEKIISTECRKGMRRIFGSQSVPKLYRSRLEEELKIIKSKNFVRYFLIVKNLVDWCKENDILIGPRGSVAGSLVAYLLDITPVDPIKYNLLFSRFISEDRIDYPDIDIDFEDSKRHMVREYLENTYGYDKIASVSSFSKLKSRAVIQDVSRVFDVPPIEVNRFTKLIDQTSEDGLKQALEETEEGIEFAEKYPSVIRLAKKLEGQIRGKSQHAAALIVSNRPLSKSGRCNLIERKGVRIINWEKEDAEYMGLMKLDALGLKFLSILSETKRLIKENHGEEIEFSEINLNDKKVLGEINKAENIGIFQISGYACSQQIKESGIYNFEDIAIAISIARPGPTQSGMAKEYNRRRKTGEWEKGHSVYEDITKETSGILVYQEQVMQVISRIAGLSESTADKIRKVIGKKRSAKEFEPYKKQFVDGCKKMKTFSPNEAEEFWEGLLEWAGYGFNKSHAIAYAMVGYWCAWLKYYYPTEFICASLTFGADDKKQEMVEEAYKMGLKVVLPMVHGNTDAIQWIAKKNKIYVPFIEVKGIGAVKAKKAKQAPRTDASLFDITEDKEFSKHDGAFGKLLDQIGAYRTNEEFDVTDDMKKFFDFRIMHNPFVEYQNLHKLFNNRLRLKDLDLALKGDYKILRRLSSKIKLVKEVKFNGYRSYIQRLQKCDRCSLVEECTSPVPASAGKYNICITGQDPGFEEDKKGEGFVGKAGDKLWKSLKYPRELFFITNINKCFPSVSKKSSDSQIESCRKWFELELRRVKPVVILAFGNNAVKFFTNRKGGITKISGTTEWSEKYKCWICWSLHPSAVLRNSSNLEFFNAGISNFKRTLKAIKFQLMV